MSEARNLGWEPYAFLLTMCVISSSLSRRGLPFGLCGQSPGRGSLLESGALSRSCEGLRNTQPPPKLLNFSSKALKAGACPPRKPAQCFGDEKPKCSSDWQCPHKKKCCLDTCGTKCLDPVNVTHPGEKVEELVGRNGTKDTALGRWGADPARPPPCRELLSQVCQEVIQPQTGCYPLGW